MAAEVVVAEADAPQISAPRTTPAALACEFRTIKRWGVFDEVDPDSAYFWTREWQRGEREADEDIKAGRHVEFDNVDDALEYLRGL